jgi:hypothetical protein
LSSQQEHPLNSAVANEDIKKNENVSKEQWHEIIGFVVESVVIFLEALAWGRNNKCFSIGIVFIKIDWKFERKINK